MEEFYQQFKDNLENRPEPEFDPAAWTDLERRMERAAGNAGRVFNWWWAAVPLLLLLLGSNFFLYRQLSHNNRQINALVLQKDTVLQRQVIFQLDTIYQTRTIREVIQVPAPEMVYPYINASNPGFLDQPKAYRSLYESGSNDYRSDLYPTVPATLGSLRRQLGVTAFSNSSDAGEGSKTSQESTIAKREPTIFTVDQLPSP